jgi:hypothetical protein
MSGNQKKSSGGFGQNAPKEAENLISKGETAVTSSLTNVANAVGGGVANVEKKFKDDLSKVEADLKNGKTSPRSFVQKFLFMLMAGLQCFVVYMVMYEIDYGIPALRTTGGPIIFQYAALIVLSFVLSFASFLVSCFPPTVEKGKEGLQKNDVLLGIDTANATVGTFLVQALSSKTWGAEGDMITILKYLIQYQVLITYVNVGFTVAWTAPHIELPDFIGTISEFFGHLDDYLNAMLQPITDFFGMVLYAICWPFIKLWGVLCFVVSYLLSFLDPIKYVVAYIIVYGGYAIHAISEWVNYIASAVAGAVVATFDAVRIFCEQVVGGIKYIWIEYLVHPVVWLYETIVNAFVSLGAAIGGAFHSCMESLSESFECIKHFWEYCKEVMVNCWEYEVVQTLDELPELFEEKRVLYHITGYVEKRGHFRTNWTTRFFTLKKGIFKYFSREGNKVPRVGEGLKGELNLVDYEKAHVIESNPLEVHIKSGPNVDKNYQFRVATEKEARNLATHLNLHIEWSKNPIGIEVQDEDTKLSSTITDNV